VWSPGRKGAVRSKYVRSKTMLPSASSDGSSQVQSRQMRAWTAMRGFVISPRVGRPVLSHPPRRLVGGPDEPAIEQGLRGLLAHLAQDGARGVEDRRGVEVANGNGLVDEGCEALDGGEFDPELRDAVGRSGGNQEWRQEETALKSQMAVTRDLSVRRCSGTALSRRFF